jgi:NitT/TauT family transport system substrate-binding protein
MNRSAALLALAAAGGAATFPRLPARAQAGLTKVRTFALAVDPCGAMFYAKELGMFEAAGLDVDISLPTDYGAVIPAMVSGSADIAYAPILQIEQAFNKQIPVTIIAPAAINDARHPTNFLLVGKDSPIKTPRDLNGKTLGSSPLKSIGTYATEAWVNLRGGDASTIKWIDIPFPLCGEAIARGRIDGAFVVEPFATASRAETTLLGRPYESISPYFLGAAYFTTPAFAAAHPDIVKRFAGAIHEASVWGNHNIAKSGPILGKYSKVDPAIIAVMSRAVYADALTPEIVQPTIDFGAKYKMLDVAFPAKDLLYHAV